MDIDPGSLSLEPRPAGDHPQSRPEPRPCGGGHPAHGRDPQVFKGRAEALSRLRVAGASFPEVDVLLEARRIDGIDSGRTHPPPTL